MILYTQINMKLEANVPGVINLFVKKRHLAFSEKCLTRLLESREV
jgi:hypothetical protein